MLRPGLWLLLTTLTLLSIVTFSSISVHANPLLNAGTIFGSAATIDTEGSLIVLGSSPTFSNGQLQAFFFKFVSSLPDSPTGQRACMRTFGDGQPLETFGTGVVTDSSDNIYIVGSTQTFGGEDYDVFLQKYDPSCNLLYTKQWGGPGNDVAHGIAVDASDNVYITGTTDSFANGQTQIFLLKYDSLGELHFSVTWGGIRNDYGMGVAVDPLGNVYVVGTTSSLGYGNGATNALLLKYDSSGNLKYQKALGGTLGGTENTYGTGVAVNAAGYVYVTGYSYALGPTPGVSTVFLQSYDQSGNLLFEKTWGGIKNDYATAVAVDLDGNVYVTGYTKSYSVTPDVPSAFLLKFDQAGNLVFQRTWGGHRGDFAYGITVDTTENVYVTGYTFSFGPNTQGTNFFILKYDISGNLMWQKLYGGGIPDP